MTTKPIIELRRIHHNERFSEETHCFTAEIWADGAPVCAVRNDGHGGADFYEGLKGQAQNAAYAAVEALEARLKATFPKIDVSCLHGNPKGTDFMEPSLEVTVAELVNEFLREKELKRLMRTRALFFKGRPAEGATAPLYEVPFKKWKPEQVLPIVEQRNPGAVILNSLPFDEALRLFAQGA